METDVLKNGPYTEYQPSYKVFGKLDGYTPKKILHAGYRTIQGCDIFSHFMMARWLAPVTACLYSAEKAVIKYYPAEWHDRVAKKHINRHSVSLDYAAYDRTVTRDLIERVMYAILAHTDIPANIQEFIVFQMTNAPLTMPDGLVMSKWGGNPSGQYWTTVLNSITHMVYVRQICDSIGLYDYELSVTGDDELISFATREEALLYTKYAPIYVQCFTGEEASFAHFKHGDSLSPVFPPGVVGPYLDCLTYYNKGFLRYAPMDFRPMRKTKNLVNSLDGEVTRDQVAGVYTSMSSARFLPRSSLTKFRLLFDEVTSICIEENIRIASTGSLAAMWFDYNDIE
jgi:hypothetical protein